jgi:NAD(P)-dependent dehydrogenase (short-subunit alcohol dehydrogenase family)
MPTALLLGGTKGLGLELAREAVRRGTDPIIYGRSTDNAAALPGVEYHPLDSHCSGSIDQAAMPSRYVDYYFWVAGAFHKARLEDSTAEDIGLLTDLHFRSPVLFLRRFLRHQTGPFHLVTIGSVSSLRLREDEALYCGLKGAKAAFTRNFAPELLRDRPGSRVTLINPGGLNVLTFWEAYPQDLTGFLDPAEVAKQIWTIMDQQKQPFLEVQIMRRKPVVAGSPPVVEYGPQCPEILTSNT